MKRNSLLLLGLMTALTLTACAARAAHPAPPPETAPASTAPPPDFAPLPPVEASAPEPEESAPALAVPEPQTEEGGYFDNALFVGDSIMEGVRRYVAAQRQEGELLGNAQFLTCSAGIALADLVGDRDWGLRFSWQGEERPLEDIVRDIAPRRVFLLLGLNDLADRDPVVDEVSDRCARLVMRLRSTCPGTEFIVMTNPPKAASQWLPEYTPNRGFDNALIGAYAAGLKAVCGAWNIPCVDVYETLKDENGALPDEFCSDGYVHLSGRGAAAVVEALKDYAETR